MSWVLSGSLLVAILAPAPEAGEKLAMRVSPELTWAPASVVVRTTIEKDPDNRALAIVAESADYYRSSTVELDGDRAAKTTTFRFESLPSGEYRVSAWLLGPGEGVRAVVHRSLVVRAVSEGPPS